jgi:hypothetical protein
MAVDLDSGSGLFNRLGKLGYIFENCDTFFAGSGSTDLPALVNNLLATYDGGTNQERGSTSQVVGTYDQLVSLQEIWYESMRQVANHTLVEMVDDDDPLEVRSVPYALRRLIEQMEAASETVKANTPTASVVAASSNIGTGTVLVIMQDGRGRLLEAAIAEDLVATIQDDFSARNESVLIESESDEAGSTANPRWPDGSGASANLTVIDPEQDGLLTNGGFEEWASGAPAEWNVTGSTIHAEEATTAFLGAKCLKFTGDGSAVPVIYQDISDFGLQSRKNYVASVAYRVPVVPAAGSLVIRLTDGSSTLVSHTISLTGLTAATWYQSAVAFRLASPVPETVRFEITVTGPLSNTRVVQVDSVYFGGEPTQLYDGGPMVAIVGGQSRFAIDDRWIITVSNSYAGKFQTLFHRLFEEPNLLLPSATGGAETISDTLIG